jgi:hypothetical protein
VRDGNATAHATRRSTPGSIVHGDTDRQCALSPPPSTRRRGCAQISARIEVAEPGGFVSFDEENEMSDSSQRGGWVTAWQAPPTDAVIRGDASLTGFVAGPF